MRGAAARSGSRRQRQEVRYYVRCRDHVILFMTRRQQVPVLITKNSLDIFYVSSMCRKALFLPGIIYIYFFVCMFAYVAQSTHPLSHSGSPAVRSHWILSADFILGHLRAAHRYTISSCSTSEKGSCTQCVFALHITTLCRLHQGGNLLIFDSIIIQNRKQDAPGKEMTTHHLRGF